MIKVNNRQLRIIQTKLKRIGNKSEQELSNELGTIALDSVRIAKRKAPVDTGTLRKEITSERTKPSQVSVLSKADYSPYIEFGTGSNVSLDDMRELGIPDSYAMQFKGSKQRGSLSPQPYFFGSVRTAFGNGLKRIDKTLKRLTR